MADLHNQQPVIGVRLLSEGATLYNNCPVIGVRAATGLVFTDNQIVRGVEVIDDDRPLYNGQPVVGAVMIDDDRELYNFHPILPVAGGIPSWVTPGPDGALPVFDAYFAAMKYYVAPYGLQLGPDGLWPAFDASFHRSAYFLRGNMPFYTDLDQFLAAADGAFSRGSDATYFDASGILRTVGPNVLRLDHNPITGKALGARLEGARTNLILGADDPATQNITVTAQAYTLSFYGTGDVTLTGAHSAVLSGVASPGRAVLTFTPSAGTLTVAVSGDVRFCQLENGTFASSYIPTTSASAQRLADSLTFARAAPPEGTVVIEGRTAAGKGSSTQVLWVWDAGSGQNRIFVQRSAGGQLSLYLIVGGATAAAVNLGALDDNADFKIAFSFSDGLLVASRDGAAPVTVVPSAPIPAFSTMRVGRQTGAGAEWFGPVARLGVFDRAYSPAELPEVWA